ncbi:MAG: class I mannose-6-phosphate isomerase [Chlamydiota bacterium]|jgi:mannose-6-phosphate isomerase
MKVYPIRFQPIYKNYLWGGEKLIQKYKRDLPSGIYAESWEISDREEGMSVVTNGIYKDMTLAKLNFEWQEKLVGKKTRVFPLLIKILDAKENLSIQVHPDDIQGSKIGAEPKNEAWYALEKGIVLAGFKPGVTPQLFKKAVENDRLVELLRKIHVQEGDVINVPGGRIHAVCQGSLLFEVQQNSDTTYRIYDWKRVDEGQKPRDLHLFQAYQVLNFQDFDNPKVTSTLMEDTTETKKILLLKTPHFNLEKIITSKDVFVEKEQQSFQIFFCVYGKGEIVADNELEKLESGVSYLIPAVAEKIEIRPKSECALLKVSLP